MAKFESLILLYVLIILMHTLVISLNLAMKHKVRLSNGQPNEGGPIFILRLLFGRQMPA